MGMAEGAAERATVPEHARAVLTVDLNALRSNYCKLAALAAPAECAGVVKADAYGLGVIPVSRALWAEGCRTFFVATIAEAQELRGNLPDAVIYVLDGLMPDTAALFVSCGARPVLGSLQEVTEWAEFCRDHAARHAAAIHIDTGMNRLGMQLDEVPLLAPRHDLLDEFELTLVISHLVSGEDPDDPKTAEQAELFDFMRAMLPPAPASLSNSAGTEIGGAYRYDLTRPGIALYGGHVLRGVPNPMLSVVELDARILQVRDIKKGATVGYNETFKAPSAMRVATVATGYADGYCRALSSRPGVMSPPVYIDGHPAPLIGRISMDYIGINVTELPEDIAYRGAWAKLIGPPVCTIDAMAVAAGTISYEVITRLAHRAHRVYLGAVE